jgi:hypothetical protein
MSKLRSKVETSPLSSVLIKLLQGFLLQEDKLTWETLLSQQIAVRDFFSTLGLYLHLDEREGYAFLRSLPEGAIEDGKITHESAMGDLQKEDLVEKKKLTLMRRVPLSFEVSLLCVLLREAMDHFDVTVRDDHRLIMTRTEIYDLLRLYFPERSDETKLIKRWDNVINKVIDLGFIRALKSDATRIEVLRIIKAMIDVERVQTMKRNMQQYVQNMQEELINE